MKNIATEASFLPYTKDLQEYCNVFKCGDDDLDEFFLKDVFLYENQLLGKSYCWLNNDNPKEILAIVTLSYNGININRLDKTSKNAFQRIIPNSKRHNSYPAVLIGRLGVNCQFQNKGHKIGSQILNFFKYWFVDSTNKAACRFIIVDAYNNESTLMFYKRNGFKFLYKTDIQEKESFGIQESCDLKSRILFFDLKLIK